MGETWLPPGSRVLRGFLNFDRDISEAYFERIVSHMSLIDQRTTVSNEMKGSLRLRARYGRLD